MREVRIEKLRKVERKRERKEGQNCERCLSNPLLLMLLRIPPPYNCVTAGRALAERWGAAFVETSAKTNENIELVFTRLLDKYDEQYETEDTPHGFGRAFHTVSDLPRQTWEVLETCCPCSCVSGNEVRLNMNKT